jgi:hypothetical protein
MPADMNCLTTIRSTLRRSRTNLGSPCSLDRIATERDVRLEMGRHRFCPEEYERHALHRVRGSGPVQDRVIVEAHAHSSDSCRRSVAMEERYPLHECRRLGFRQQALPRSKTNLGPSDLAEIYSSGRAEGWNREAIRMAHVPAHILDSVAKCGDRVQGDAGTASPFVIPLDIGCLHPGSYSGEACSTSRRIVAGLFARCGRGSLQAGQKTATP